jgi:hypothetical protein
LTKFDGESYEFNFSKFTRAPYETDLPNEHFRVEQLASIALAPNDALQQYMEDHESEIFREERNEIDRILLCQPELLKYNLPMEDLGTTLPPKEDPVFDLKPLPDDLKLMIRKYILLLLVINFQVRKKKGYWKYGGNTEELWDILLMI